MKTRFLFVCIFSILSFSLSARDYYVSPILGDDGNSGNSAETPFRTLGKIQQLELQPGDTVYLMDGTYERSGQTLLIITESGTADQWITIRNFPGHSPLLKFNTWTGIDLINGASYIAFEGIRIQGAAADIDPEDALNQPGSCANNQEGGAVGLYNGTGILAVGPNLLWSPAATTGDEIPHHIRIENCEIFDCTSSGVAFQQADYITIRNCRVYNNAWYTLFGTSGINFYQFINTDGTPGVHNIIENNLMYGNELRVPQVPFCEFLDGNGLIVDDFKHTQTKNYKDKNRTFPSYTAQTVVRNNIAVENGGSGLHFFLSSHCRIYNNTVVENAYQNEGINSNGDLRVGACSDFTIQNNIFKGDIRLHVYGENDSIVYTHNYQEGPAIEAELVNCEGCVEEGITFQNKDVTTDQPYITTGSLLKDSGISLGLVSQDYVFADRPADSISDIGAYEFGGCAATLWYIDRDKDGFGSILQTTRACSQPEGFADNADDQCDANPDSIVATTWYVDRDGDGVGSEVQTITDCNAPEGFVAVSGDLCDRDPFKTEPGECGCGKVEETCEESIDSCTAPAFSPTTVYDEPGTAVTFEGKAYKNKWYASGTLPTSGGPWELVKVCGGEGTDCTAIPVWNSATTYGNQGSTIRFEGKIYSNRWYTRSDIPGQSEVWQLQDICSPASLASAPSVSVALFSATKELAVTTPENSQLRMLSFTGEQMMIQNLKDGSTNISVQGLKSGIYFVSVIGETVSEIKKVMVE